MVSSLGGLLLKSKFGENQQSSQDPPPMLPYDTGMLVKGKGWKLAMLHGMRKGIITGNGGRATATY